MSVKSGTFLFPCCCVFPRIFSALLVYINKSRLYRLHILVSKNRMELGHPNLPPFPFTPLRKILGPKSLPRKGRHCGSWAENCLAVKRSHVQFLAAPVKDQKADNMEAPTWPWRTAASQSRKYWSWVSRRLSQFKVASCVFISGSPKGKAASVEINSTILGWVIPVQAPFCQCT